MARHDLKALAEEARALRQKINEACWDAPAGSKAETATDEAAVLLGRVRKILLEVA